MILDNIIVHKRKELEEKKVRYPLSKILERLDFTYVRRRDFKKALLAPMLDRLRKWDKQAVRLHTH